MARNPKVEFDLLQMYFGEPYHINLEGIPGEIIVYSPTIGDIIRVGEKRFYATLSIFIGNTTQYRVPLWDMGIDWNVITDFMLFVMLYKNIDHDVSKLMFGDLDFSKFEPVMKKIDPDSEEDGEVILWDEDDQIEINYDVWNHFSQYLRAVTNTFPEEKITNSDFLKDWYIKKDKRNIEHMKEQEAQGKVKASSMQPIISACVNHPGFKYKLKELKDVGIFEFFDSVNRLQIYEHSTAVMKGMYSGFVDGSKIKPEDYNWMKDIPRDTNNSISKSKTLKEQG